MSVLELLVAIEMRPFTVALGVVLGLTLLELVLLVIGTSMFGGDGADPMATADGDLDLDAQLAEALREGGELEPTTGPLQALGLGHVPFVLWFASVLTAFGITGYGLQVAALAVWGGFLPHWAAAGLALAPAVLAGASFARFVGRLVPQLETQSIPRRRLGGRVGVIVVGTARRGSPAEARVDDRYGNRHYIRVEPLDDGTAIAAGEDVVILAMRDGAFRAVPVGDTDRALELVRTL